MLYDVLLCFFLTLSPPSLSQMAFVSACAALPRGGESFDLLQCSGHGSVFYLRGLYGTCDMQIRGSSILNHNQVEAPTGGTEAFRSQPRNLYPNAGLLEA